MNKSLLSRLVFQVLLLIVSTTAMGSDEDFFVFGGFHLRQTPIQLSKVFPLSQIQQSNKDNGNPNQDVVVKINPREVKDQVTYAQYFAYAGKLQKLQLNFERSLPPGMPGSYFNDPFNQSPACDTVLPSLEQAYGKPTGPHVRYTDTDLIEHAYVWEKIDQKLVLYCARIPDTKGTRTWVMGITIAPSKDDDCRNMACFYPVL